MDHAWYCVKRPSLANGDHVCVPCANCKEWAPKCTVAGKTIPSRPKCKSPFGTPASKSVQYAKSVQMRGRATPAAWYTHAYTPLECAAHDLEDAQRAKQPSDGDQHPQRRPPLNLSTH